MEIIGTLQFLKFGGALALVVALMLGLGVVMRRVNSGSGFGISGAERRLKIIETLPLSTRHRAMIIKRDDVEHLVILGPAGETVVERGFAQPSPVKD